MNDIIYLWYVRDLIDPKSVERPLAYYAPGRFFAWATGEPASASLIEDELFDNLEWMVMEGGVRWNGTGLASCNVREGRPFATEHSPAPVGADAGREPGREE